MALECVHVGVRVHSRGGHDSNPLHSPALPATRRPRARPDNRQQEARDRLDSRFRSLWSGFFFVLSMMTARAVDRPVTRERRTSSLQDISGGGRCDTPPRMRLPPTKSMFPSAGDADRNRSRRCDPRLLGPEARPKNRCRFRAVRNFIWIRADQSGVFAGACAEYCGAQHAWMRFRVVAQDQPSYDSWLNAQAAPARPHR